MTWSIHPMPAPADLASPQAWALHGGAQVTRATELAHWGHPDLMYPAQYLGAYLREQEYVERFGLVTVAANPQPRADDVLALAMVGLPKRDNTHLAFVEIFVHPDHARRGIGTALMTECERIARDRGRTMIICWTAHPGEPDPDTPGVLVPPTGSGLIHPDSPPARFIQRHGFALEQAERYSVLRLPVDPARLSHLHADSQATAGPDYRLHLWADRVPDEWVDQYAGLKARMSTDAPKAGLAIQETSWDAARVRSNEAELAAAGDGSLTVIAEHLPTRAMAAFTWLRYTHGQPDFLFQEDTLVVPEHRGHRLGMLVKSELLLRLPELRPDARRIHTWNAEENEHMLNINVALGFRPTGVYGTWQKKLT